jgi:hypothetical protein
MMKKYIIVTTILFSLVAVVWISDVVSDRMNKIVILKPIRLLENAPQNYPPTNNEIGKIGIGEQVVVLRMGYGKDYRAWKIRGSMGQEGWFIEEHGDLEITDR